MRKLGWAVLVAAVMIAAGWLAWILLREDIGMTLFERQAQEFVGTDPSAELEDGLHVYLCGTGSPLPDVSRAGPCVGVLAGKSAFIFDTGSGSIRKLARMGFPVSRTRTVYLTHLHSDHIDSLGEVMLQAWVGGSRSAPLPIAGPKGTATVVDGFNMAYSIDAPYRTAHHGEEIANPQGFGGAAEEISLGQFQRQAVVHESGGVTITVFRVDHSPVEPAFGYRIDYGGRSVTISGDTVPSDAVVAVARDADLLLHEALNRDMVRLMADAAKSNGNSALAKIFSDILDYHTSPAEAADIADRAGAGTLVLTHIVPPLPSRVLYPAFLGNARNDFSGKIIVGEDGMLISLPANEGAISVQQRLD